MKKIMSLVLTLLFVGACAGWQRDCSSCTAGSLGADWIIVQYANDGAPIACWKLDDVAVSNEDKSDGIFWVQDGHLVHISGWYNRVQVDGGRYAQAAQLLGVRLGLCVNGKYFEPAQETTK